MWHQTIQGDCSGRCWSSFLSVLSLPGSSWSTWTNGSCWSAWRCCEYLKYSCWGFLQDFSCGLKLIRMSTLCGAGSWRRAGPEGTTGSLWSQRWWRIPRIPRSTRSYWTAGKIITVSSTWIEIIAVFLKFSVTFVSLECQRSKVKQEVIHPKFKNIWYFWI